ncbi:MAG: STAS domain-containing protein [Spirosomataceae bacterium]
MNYQVEKNEQYALIELSEQSFGETIIPDFEKLFRNLYREGYCNVVVDFNEIIELDGYGVSFIRKANKMCLNESGLFILVTKNAEIIQQLDRAKIEDLTIMPTTAEATDAVYMNELENEFRAEEDGDDYGFGEETGGRDEDY